MKKLFCIIIFFVFLWKDNSFSALFYASAMHIKYCKCLAKILWLCIRLQENEEFRSVPQFEPEISVGLFLYEYQKRYSGWFANPLRKRSPNRHHLNVVALWKRQQITPGPVKRLENKH